jgi:cytochrome c peroxidase
MFHRQLSRLSLAVCLSLTALGIAKPVAAIGFGPLPASLKGVPVPPVPGLLDGNSPIIQDQSMAIALGKALFWDTSIGSDGMACASCHFHAGADTRSKNQLAPGGKFSTLPTAQTFQPTASGKTGGPNYSVNSADFPFYQLSDPLDPGSTLLFQSDDVFGSSGTFSGNFSAVLANNFALASTDSNDICQRSADPIYHVGSTGTRKVTPRNTPTVVNAIFNYRSFWDGRANNVFNGSSPWGDRDPNAGVWVNSGKSAIVKQRLELINSSIASVTMAAPIDITEMSCASRTFPDLGRKMLNRYALANQVVHYQDSVLGPLSNSNGLNDPNNLQTGLYYTYRDLVMMAFNPIYQGSRPNASQFGSPTAAGSVAYNQTEANFSMFFGLALQMYISTLVSDDSPFDKSARDANGLPTALSASALNGLDQFRNNSCAICHIGATFTSATVASNAQLVQTQPQAFGSPDMVIKTSSSVVNRLQSVAGSTLIDTGFSSTGVSPDGADLGLGGVDAFGNPLAFSLQYLQYLAGNSAGVFDSAVASTVKPCNFQLAFAVNIPVANKGLFTQTDGITPQALGSSGCITPSFGYQPTAAAVKKALAQTNSAKTLAVVNGMYKIPSLRNIELTGPYMHNGSMSSLEQVLEFYARGGNFAPQGKNFAFVFQNSDLGANAQTRADIITFLKTLTDDRVRYERAPFDHPGITITHGHAGSNSTITAGNPVSAALAADEVLVIDAVGANGNTTPLSSFAQMLPAP